MDNGNLEFTYFGHSSASSLLSDDELDVDTLTFNIAHDSAASSSSQIFFSSAPSKLGIGLNCHQFIIFDIFQYRIVWIDDWCC
jgi:hypothetical protein